MSVPARQLVPNDDDHDDIVVIRNATWADFERMLEIRGDGSVPRMAYLEGALELMSPSRAHESIKSVIGRLVEAYCVEVGIEITPYGSWTLEKKEVESAVEPDECYVIGDELEPTSPDFAIEVVWTSGGVNKLAIYRRLGVREVWFWRRGAIEVFVLRGDAYVPTASSEALPGIDPAQIASFAEERPMTRAVRSYVRALRSTRSQL